MATSEEELERLAREEILRESRRGAERAKEFGAYGWEKPRIRPANKVFLRNTILSTVRRPQAKSAKRKDSASEPGSSLTEKNDGSKRAKPSPSGQRAKKKS
uniref:Uncharacterized protein n=1 Tax=Ornithodoros turicata TaxID=34597 RepID=A0A2R5LC60_9ACAR